MIHARAFLVEVLFALILGLTGCGTVPSSDPHAGMNELIPPSGAYQLWYLAPPWEVVSNEEGHAELRVPTSGDALVSGGTTGAVVALSVHEIAGTDPLGWVSGQMATDMASGAHLSRAPEFMRPANGTLADCAVDNASGSTRYAAMSLAGGRLVTLEFNAPTPLGSDPDVTSMLSQLTPTSLP